MPVTSLDSLSRRIHGRVVGAHRARDRIHRCINRITYRDMSGITAERTISICAEVHDGHQRFRRRFCRLCSLAVTRTGKLITRCKVVHAPADLLLEDFRLDNVGIEAAGTEPRRQLTEHLGIRLHSRMHNALQTGRVEEEFSTDCPPEISRQLLQLANERFGRMSKGRATFQRRGTGSRQLGHRIPRRGQNQADSSHRLHMARQPTFIGIQGCVVNSLQMISADTEVFGHTGFLPGSETIQPTAKNRSG
ncbi:hypothetical protein IPC3_22360 [Pseudomonas aeruginosa]|nr:hypothetical protein IPC3_22360 [Pseudomonas aeruginosa]